MSFQPSSLPLSRDGPPSRRGLSGLVLKFWGRRSSRSARQSPNPEHMAATSRAHVHDLLPAQTTQDPHCSHSHSRTKSSNSSIPKMNSIIITEQLDPKFVDERIADATKGVAGMKNVPEMVENTASATNNLLSIPSDTIDTFSAILNH
ncbi:uncharacterized protein EDB91DRAFT_1247248 [Suillus paluster]|uniref:uncharacterized protein n=1 Tax=Suillus paluster TaxID=48578 RepID=UPI001B85E095|nr:uncharacterized protein EDB91DRAFT_1247248 [Suillus paluster]KAG1743757.1 hypothetical protein EDB91DRAFT_1247248 [Suillus paluster]